MDEEECHQKIRSVLVVSAGACVEEVKRIEIPKSHRFPHTCIVARYLIEEG